MDFAEVRELQAREPDGPTANEYTSVFARGLVHKMNNLLTVFQGYTSLLLADPDLKKSTTEALQEIRKGALATNTLLDRALNVSKRLSVDLVDLDLAQFAAGLRESIEKSLGTIPQLELGDQPNGRAIADATQLRRALAAIVENAMHATESGGGIVIEWSRHSRRDTPMHIVSVLDNGPGIQPEHLGEVWEPFFSRKKERGCLGLGLALVRHIAKSTGMETALATSPGVGTRVDLRLLASGG